MIWLKRALNVHLVDPYQVENRTGTGFSDISAVGIYH
jgi:hypothetical protein